MKRPLLLVVFMTSAALLLVCGVALAVDVTCEPGSTDENPCRGTADPDTLIGTASIDYMYGFAGADTLDGAGARDFMHGGAQNDVLRGRPGSDWIYGDNTEPGGVSGNDLVHGGYGDDFLYGGPGFDRVRGGLGNDELHEHGVAFALDGDNKGDKHWGGEGNDEYYDESLTGTGYDEFYGEAGNDLMLFGNGPSIVDGGPGEDFFAAYGCYNGPVCPSAEVTIEAVDGERDVIECYELPEEHGGPVGAFVETVRADPKDVFKEDAFGSRRNCESVTIVR